MTDTQIALGFFFDKKLRKVRSGLIKGSFIALSGETATVYSREGETVLESFPATDAALVGAVAKLMTP